jgi:hypothetical protein
MQIRNRKLPEKAFHQMGAKGEDKRKIAAGKAAGRKTWCTLLQNSRFVMVHGLWWWPWD